MVFGQDVLEDPVAEELEQFVVRRGRALLKNLLPLFQRIQEALVHAMVMRVLGIGVLAQQLLFAREVHPGEVLEEAEYPRKHLRALSGGDALMKPVGRVEKLLVMLVYLGNAG